MHLNKIRLCLFVCETVYQYSFKLENLQKNVNLVYTEMFQVCELN